ncbi:uncharacterized protein LOC110715366 isoform X4 [Chenopodium quinoa]|uniref:uncharacterized protein LOC110715366 isoform X4 n=1 Tax=Chenopodium quinoa TaxID=63459 RepID=UPI000B793695|nr:uncharacterized protein LOC110715366 isoform X4 [Chenopodium quinoa]
MNNPCGNLQFEVYYTVAVSALSTIDMQIGHLSLLLQPLPKQRQVSLLSDTQNFANNMAFAVDNRRPNSYQNNSSASFRPQNFNTWNRFSQSSQTGSNNSGFGRGAPVRKFSTLFCEYCKMSGHTVEICYKVHGYPPNNAAYKGKGRRIAAIVYSDEADDGSEKPIETAHISSKDYSRMMQVMHTQGDFQNTAPAESVNAQNLVHSTYSSAHMAGDFFPSGKVPEQEILSVIDVPSGKMGCIIGKKGATIQFIKESCKNFHWR